MATTRQKMAAKEVVENGGNVSKAMRKVGYSPNTAKTPQKLTESVGWDELMEEFLSDKELQEKHRGLLNATKIEHMTFPLGPKGEDDPNLSGASPELEDDGSEDDPESKRLKAERTTLTDKEIIDMLAEVNCKVKRIVHGETVRHVYYWVLDAKARKDALDMAYKLKGRYATEKVDVTTKGEKVNIDDNQFNQLVRAAAARGESNTGSGSSS